MKDFWIVIVVGTYYDWRIAPVCIVCWLGIALFLLARHKRRNPERFEELCVEVHKQKKERK